MSPGGWFKRRSKAANKAVRKQLDALPDGLWTKCSKCSEILFSKELERNLRVCNRCGYHFKLGAAERLAITVDEDSFVEMDTDLVSVNPLDFPAYESKIEKWKTASGLNDGMVTGVAAIGGQPVVIGVADFGFLGGSMGSVYGEKVTRAFERGMDERLPVLIVNTSGGARMQEGIISLMQMAKTSAAAAQFDRAGLMYIAIFGDPTMAGVHASFAMLADVIIAEPGALIGLAGQRVAAQAQVLKEPPGYRLAEWQLEHGMVDMVLPRREIRDTLIKLLDCGARRQ
ncbi:MAG TPA: acetyl-CoA carboxylase, carboxyltransferase subunit beta [Armatimonadota bacterium]|nr:acetyl-CoA carboxylase, carboxyltransferase subunit beta [Armatimonadota bacterium]